MEEDEILEPQEEKMDSVSEHNSSSDDTTDNVNDAFKQLDDNYRSQEAQYLTDYNAAVEAEKDRLKKQLEGYDNILKQFQQESDKDKAKREKHERSKRIISAISDGIGALSNLYFTTQYAPDMSVDASHSQTAQTNAAIERAKAEREKNKENHLRFALQRGTAESNGIAALRSLKDDYEKAKANRLALYLKQKDDWRKDRAANDPDLAAYNKAKAENMEAVRDRNKIKADNTQREMDANIDAKNRSNTGHSSGGGGSTFTATYSDGVEIEIPNSSLHNEWNKVSDKIKKKYIRTDSYDQSLSVNRDDMKRAVVEWYSTRPSGTSKKQNPMGSGKKKNPMD